MSEETVLAEALGEAGLPAGAVRLAPPPEPGAPQPPEGPWLVVPFGSRFVVGAVGRGRFAPYESMWTLEDAVRLAVGLAAAPLSPGRVPADEGVRERGRATAAALIERTRARGGAPGPTGVGPGDLLDSVGLETVHHAYALGTAFARRSQPPTDLEAPYFALEVARDLPETVHEGVAAPWFGQPGGGAMVVLDRPVRWYVDQGLLVPLPPEGPAEPAESVEG